MNTEQIELVEKLEQLELIDGEKKIGKRGRKPKDYINNVKIDEDEIAESIILNESVNQHKKQKDPYSDLD